VLPVTEVVVKAAIYARVSTVDQEPENQLQELRRYVEARGWTAFRPHTELLPGVPLVQVCGQDEMLLLTKAGGFGTVDLIAKIKAHIEG